VQGTGADIMTIARIVFAKRLAQKDWGNLVLLVSSVHDSIVVDAPAKLLNNVAQLFHEVFDDLQKNIYKLHLIWLVRMDILLGKRITKNRVGETSRRGMAYYNIFLFK
jgi:DNA polymerase I-like protein with 3'-5' exonuclease and polymerase domains